MTPPQARSEGKTADGLTPAAVFLRLETLKKRSDFLRASRARRVAMPGFVVQVQPRPQSEPDVMRVGFTCSKKVGNAVARNRAKRRLREVARAVLPRHGQAGYDYVLIGRAKATATLPFDLLCTDLEKALGKLRSLKR